MWQKESRIFRQSLGLDVKAKPWTGRSRFQGTGLSKTARILDLLDCFAALKISQHVGQGKGFQVSEAGIQKLMKNQYIDVSQSLNRHTHTNTFGINHTLTTSSVLYSYGLDRVLTGREHMFLHGHAKDTFFSDMSPAVLRELAGEGMALPSLAAVIWSLFVCKRFPLE